MSKKDDLIAALRQLHDEACPARTSEDLQYTMGTPPRLDCCRCSWHHELFRLQYATTKLAIEKTIEAQNLSPRQGVAYVIRKIDEWLSADLFETCNTFLLFSLPATSFCKEVNLAILTAAKPAKAHLSCYGSFLNAFSDTIGAEHKSELLYGLD